MKKNGIVHFVGFATRLDAPVFVEQWSQYAKEYKGAPGSLLLEEKTGGIGKFNYISRHVFNEQDFNFSFMKGRISESFPEQGAKVNMLGGYVPTETRSDTRKEKPGLKIIACMSKDRLELDQYRDLSQGSPMNIYEPFFENCKYSLILEFLVSKSLAAGVLEELLKRKESPEISLYRNCPFPYPGSRATPAVFDTAAK